MPDKAEAKIVEQVLHKVAKENDIINYKLAIKPISSGGANYMSHLYVGTYKTKKTNEYINIFAKIAAVGDNIRQGRTVNIFHTEIHFYTSTATKFRGLEAVFGIKGDDKLHLPKFYGVHADVYQETIVLENLISSGYGMHDRMKSVDWEYAAAAMRELAKFHALSAAYQRVDPQAFEEDADRFKSSFPEANQMRVFWDGAIARAMAKVRPENLESINRFMASGMLDVNAFLKFIESSKQNMLIHADYRPSNMMHRTLKNGKVDLVPVDFQTIQVGSPVQDFIYFMVCATDEEFRKQYYDRMVDYYCDQLQEALARLKLDSSVYSKQDFLDELKEKLKFGLTYAFCILPVVTVEEDKAPVVNKEFDMTNMVAAETSSLFEIRLNGMINDYRRWGILV